MKRSPPPRRKTPLKTQSELSGRGESLKPRVGLRRGKRLKPASDKTIEARDEHAEVRAAVFARDGRQCRVAPFLPDDPCFGPPTVHHVVKSGQGGAYTEDNLVTACAHHNSWIEDNPDTARALGLVQSAAPQPGPLYRRGVDPAP